MVMFAVPAVKNEYFDDVDAMKKIANVFNVQCFYTREKQRDVAVQKAGIEAGSLLDFRVTESRP